MASGQHLYDPGRIAVAVMGGPLAHYFNRGEPSDKHTSAAQLRAEAAALPGDSSDAVLASVVRALSWLLLLFAMLGGFIIASFVHGLAGEAVTPVLMPLKVFTAYGGMFAAGSLLVSVARWTFAASVGYRGFPASDYPLGKQEWHEKERRRRETIARQGGPNAVIRWMATPSILDALPALAFMLIFGPLIV